MFASSAVKILSDNSSVNDMQIFEKNSSCTTIPSQHLILIRVALYIDWNYSLTYLLTQRTIYCDKMKDNTSTYMSELKVEVCGWEGLQMWVRKVLGENS
jgi:hypothetical protein